MDLGGVTNAVSSTLQGLRSDLDEASQKAIQEADKLISNGLEQVDKIKGAISKTEQDAISEAKQVVETAKTDLTRAAAQVNTVIQHTETSIQKSISSAATHAIDSVQGAIGQCTDAR